MIESLENRRLLAAEFGSLITFGDPNDINRGNAVAVDAAGNIYVAGAFRDEADVASGRKRERVIRATGDDDYDDAFLLKYAPDKTLIWAQTFGSAIGNDGITHIELGPDGSVHVAGYFRGTVDFAPGKARHELKGYGDRDAFLAKYTEDGELVWAGNIGGKRDDEITALAVGPDGDVYFAGTVRLSGDIDPSTRVRKVSNRGVDDTFISRLNGNNGRQRWVKQYGEENTREGVNGMVVDKTGVYVTGTFNRTVQFSRGNNDFTITQRKYDDAYLARLSLDGDWQWIGQIGSEEREAGVAIAFGPKGDLYVTGNFGASADFEFGKGQTILRPEGHDDVFVARYRRTGALIWARNVGAAHDDDGRVRSTAIAVDAAGNAYVAGMFHEEIDFDAAGGSEVRDAEKDDAPSFSEIGGTDAFVLKLNRNGKFRDVTRTGGQEGTAVPYDIALFGNSVYTIGQFGGGIDFEPGRGTTRRRTDDDGDESDVFLWELVDNG